MQHTLLWKYTPGFEPSALPIEPQARVNVVVKEDDISEKSCWCCLWMKEPHEMRFCLHVLWLVYISIAVTWPALQCSYEGKPVWCFIHPHFYYCSSMNSDEVIQYTLTPDTHYKIFSFLLLKKAYSFTCSDLILLSSFLSDIPSVFVAVWTFTKAGL